MPKLVALALPPGPRFVEELAAAWAAGDAVLPVDTRLPEPAQRAVVEALRVGEPVEAGDALVVATSGTTGAPKGVVLTHEAVAASAEVTSRRLGVDPATDVWLAILPVAHVGGLSVVTRALATGTPFTFDEADAATLTSVVPTQADRLDLSRFRKVLVGGSADWRDRPSNVVSTYGLTETGSGVVYDGVPLDGVDVRVDGATGEISIRGPMLLRAYRDGTDPKDANGWFRTGDGGHLDDDGRLVAHGRLADVVVTGGEKVWPTPVEDALRTHPSVGDVAVAGLPDDEWGQRVVAWVVPAPEHVLDLGVLREHVKQVLPAFAAPRELIVVEQLPRTPSGKVLRKELPRNR
ncbi:MAG: o-succinylbenzoate---CoA ligase [Actinomycetota bacterium]|nr:o-succinylbenzoate---CoA ligase [Actinomycetota bacterium]